EEAGCLYVFYDPAQNLYNERGVFIPALGKPFRLPTNCRNTQSIANTCGDIIDRPIETKRGTPVGIETEVLFLDDHRKTIGRLNDWVKDWTKREGIRPSQIAILFPLRKDNSVLADQRDLGGTDLTENLEDWQADRGVLFSTIRSFKGLESDIVVLVDVIEPDVMSTFL
ncbi:hypothetical protein, partial [Thiolapillus sp.]